VRPGLTGWAQVNGLRADTERLDMMHKRVRYDAEYLRRRSLWFDLKILAMTLLLVVRGKLTPP
jgi:putative colanic acid biosynthesis UDP-glucose lipid carrier transferase